MACLTDTVTRHGLERRAMCFIYLKKETQEDILRGIQLLLLQQDMPIVQQDMPIVQQDMPIAQQDHISRLGVRRGGRPQ
jgi:hypothetical protein